jgi:hypothetical protein
MPHKCLNYFSFIQFFAETISPKGPKHANKSDKNTKRKKLEKNATHLSNAGKSWM